MTPPALKHHLTRASMFCPREGATIHSDSITKRFVFPVPGYDASHSFVHQLTKLKQLKFDMNKVVLKAIRITGDVLYQHGVFPAVIKAIDDGRLDKEILQSMITTRVTLDEVEEKGIKELINNKSRHIKILIKVGN